MAYAHAEHMTESEARDVILPILRKRLGGYGFDGVDVGEEVTFDGSSILRVVARVAAKVPAEDLVDTLDAVHAALRKKGEARFAFLSTRIPGDETNEADEDVE